MLTFKLGGNAALPEPRVTHLELPEPPDIEATQGEIAEGETLYHTYCATCHGPGVISSGGGTPDLRYANEDVHSSWNAIVLQGAFTGRGMVGFDHVLSPDDARAIQAYVVNQAEASIELCSSEYRKQYPEVVGSACTRATETAAR